MDDLDLDDDNLEQVRAVLRQLLGQVEPAPEPEPAAGANVVPSEGRSSGKPRISPDQYSRDFLRRINGTIPTLADRLPEDS